MSTKKKPKALDLFCGCGGLTLGLKKAGFRVIGGIDNDPVAVETYKMNHPEVKVWEKNIQRLPVKQVMKKLALKKGSLDLLAGCPPCQGFSGLRTLQGSKKVRDPRNKLIFEFLRFVRVLKPKTIMMENVPGLANSNMFKKFCAKLKKLGYQFDPKVKISDAANYGVPQRRRRLILLASLVGSIDFAKPTLQKVTVRHTIGDMSKPGTSGDFLHDWPENHSNRIKNLIKSIPKDGGSRTDLPQSQQLDCHKKFSGFKDIYGRMAWDKVAPTITSGCFNPSKGRFLHPTSNRAITLREASLLQGFPKRYKFPHVRSKSAIALLIGNALPPPFIRRHAIEIKKQLLGI